METYDDRAKLIGTGQTLEQIVAERDALQAELAREKQAVDAMEKRGDVAVAALAEAQQALREIASIKPDMTEWGDQANYKRAVKAKAIADRALAAAGAGEPPTRVPCGCYAKWDGSEWRVTGSWGGPCDHKLGDRLDGAPPAGAGEPPEQT